MQDTVAGSPTVSQADMAYMLIFDELLFELTIHCKVLKLMWQLTVAASISLFIDLYTCACIRMYVCIFVCSVFQLRMQVICAFHFLVRLLNYCQVVI